jgi:hypothetical protein
MNQLLRRLEQVTDLARPLLAGVVRILTALANARETKGGRAS